MKVINFIAVGLLVFALAFYADAATYRQCTPGSSGCYPYTGSCYGANAPDSGTVWFTNPNIRCCQCNDDDYSCYGCTSYGACTYAWNKCDGATRLATGILIAVIVIPVAIVVIVTIIVICCCCCAAAAAASGSSSHTVSGTTVVVTQTEPEPMVVHEPQPGYYVQNNTVEMTPVSNEYGQPVYVQTQNYETQPPAYAYSNY